MTGAALATCCCITGVAVACAGVATGRAIVFGVKLVPDSGVEATDGVATGVDTATGG